MSSNTMPINIRFSKEEQLKYEMQATSLDLPLRTYLKQKIDYNDRLLDEMTSLRRIASQLTELDHEHKSSAMMIEILLLLRQIAQPKHMQLAHTEIKRLGLTPWSSL